MGLVNNRWKGRGRRKRACWPFGSPSKKNRSPDPQQSIIAGNSPEPTVRSIPTQTTRQSKPFVSQLQSPSQTFSN